MMLSFFVKALLVRTRPPLKSQFSIYAPPHLPYFSPLAHSQNPYTPDLHHSKSLAHSSEEHGGIPPKSEAPAKLLHLFASEFASTPFLPFVFSQSRNPFAGITTRYFSPQHNGGPCMETAKCPR